MVRPRNHATGAQPFDTLAVADIGDVGVCLYDIKFVPPFFPSLQLILEKVKTGPKTMTMAFEFVLSKNPGPNF